MSILQFKNANCKNCYKCVRFCPVKSIKIEHHQAKIIESSCILCGNCTTVCPQNAKEDISDIPKVKELIKRKQVIASVAPSYFAYFDVNSQTEFSEALKKLGFHDAFETAEGAYLVKTKFEKNEKTASEAPVISSCCSTVNLYIEKYFPKALPYLAPVESPMQAHVELLRKKYPDSAVIFISPCISKKSECANGKGADFCITFDELEQWFKEENISFESRNEQIDRKFTRQFPISGGILGSMNKTDGRHYLLADGLDSCRVVLQEIIDGKLNNCFIEMNSCKGGCIGGPSFRKRGENGLSAQLKIRQFSGEDYAEDYNIKSRDLLERKFIAEEIYDPQPTTRQLEAILKKMGKRSPADELNCGMCGYSSCREKAYAVFAGKAEISMCLPFMKERAESLSDSILDITPNSIVAVDMDLRVQQINASACRLFDIESADIVGLPVSHILDEFDFVEMISSEKNEMTKHAYLAEYNVYLEQDFRFDKSAGIVICVMKNITESRQRQNNLRKAKVQAANMADEIVEKQLHVVHEIAALLGETAAETKAAVHNLKETIMMDSEDD